MNYMKKVADMLGVRLGEEFDLTEGEEVSRGYKLTKNGLSKSSEVGSIYPTTLTEILAGGVEIKRRPWKPKIGRKYFYYDWCSDRSKWLLVEENFEGFPYDLNNLSMGNCFETGDDAEAHKKDVIARYEAILDALRNKER